MRLGFVGNFSEDRVKFAKEAGFECLELFASGPLDPENASEDDVKKVKETLHRYGVPVASIFHYRDYAQDTEAAMKAFRRTMDFCKILSADLITCNAWVPRGDLEEQLAFFKKVFSQFAGWAEALGMRVAIENCPHGDRSIALSPFTWGRMFELVPSRATGLEFDPSHLVFQGVDYVEAIQDFGDRIYAFHAKDTEILHRSLKRQGNLIPGWWRFRIPGWGDVDWKSVFIALGDIGYGGDIFIEHEDPVFGGERTEEGLRLGLHFLRQFVS